MKNKYQKGGMPSKSKPAALRSGFKTRPKGLKPSTGKTKPAVKPSDMKKRKKDLSSIGIEESKELKFGGPIGVKAKKGRVKRGNGGEDELRPGDPGYMVEASKRAAQSEGPIGEAIRSAEAAKRGAQNAEKKRIADEAAARRGPSREEKQNTRQGAGDGKATGSTMDRIGAMGRGETSPKPEDVGATRAGSSKATQDARAKGVAGQAADDAKRKAAAEPKKGTYEYAKKQNSNIDALIKRRKGLTKGTPEYNKIQNQINTAYGKGSTTRNTTPTASLARRDVKSVDSKQPEQKLQISKPSTSTSSTSKTPSGSVSEKAAAKVSKIKDRRAKAAARQENRADNKNDRSANRSFRKNERQGSRDDNKQRRMDNREDRQDRRDSRKDQRKIDRSAIKQARKAQMGGPRKKAIAGAMVAGGGQALKGVGSLVNAIAGKETKFGNIANSVGEVAGGIGSMMGPGGAAVNKVGGALNNAVAPGAPEVQVGANAGANAGANPQNPDMPTQRYGGIKKKKGKKGMMKYKTGGAKPDYLDMDKDGNKTESMRSALKDRRRRGGRR